MTGEPRSSLRPDPFKSVAPDYEGWFVDPLGAFVDRLELEALDAILPVPGDGIVVEVGAGTGHVSRHLAGLGFRVLALEPSRAMRSEGRARNAGSGVAWAAALAEALPLPDTSTEGVLFFTTLEFVASPNGAIAEALRVLRPGGWLAIAFLDADGAWTPLYRSFAVQGRAPWTSAHFFRQPQLEALVGSPSDQKASAVHLPPGSRAPFAEAELAAARTGKDPALRILLWRKP